MDVNKNRYDKIPKYKLIGFIGDMLIANNKTEKEIKEVIKPLNRMKKNDLFQYIMKNYNKEFYAQPVSFFEKYENPKVFNFHQKLGLNKLSKKELEEYKINLEDFKDPYIGKEVIKTKFDTGDKTKELIKLVEHQKKFLNGFLIGNLRCSIAFHGVGTGKTLTAVASANMYLQLYPNNKVIVITPPAVLYNFIESMIAFGIDPRDPRFQYFTYDKFYRSRIKADNALLIVDEAHNFRTEITTSSFKDETTGQIITDVMQNKKGYALLQRGGKPAHKVLLLTATPFVNKLYDIENLLAIAEGRDPVDESTFGDITSDDNTRYDYFKYRISHYEKDPDSSMFPKRIETFVPLVVPKADEGKIRANASPKENPFYIRTRQASSKFEKLKVNYVLKEIKSDDKKYVCYTSFQEYGYEPLEKALRKANINYAIISGKVSTGNKKSAIDAYNNYDMNDNEDGDPYNGPKARVLIITKAGAEGVNLKRTKTIFIMDGQWNDALYEQIVARAIRFKSHMRVPEKDRQVFVKKLFLCYKNEAKDLEEINKGKAFDFKEMINKILDNRAELKKIRQLEKADKKLEQGVDKNLGISKKEIDEFMNKIATFGDLEFDIEKLQTLKKGSSEKAKYLRENQAFAKSKEKYLTDEILALTEETPSTDYYMFILQKTKQMVIDAFIKKIDKIPSTEKSIMDLPLGSKLFKLIQDKKMTGEEMMKYLITELRPQMKETVKLIGKNLINQEEKLKKLLESRKALTDLQKQKQLIKIGQEYFTPLEEAKALFKLSNLERDYKDATIMNILEPSAGQGGLLKPIIDFYANLKQNEYMPKIDMVEFADDNRKILQEYVDKAPDNFALMKTRDFLEFTPNKDYKYIFMNPPFHLDKRLNKKYKKDYYDYDFIKRAYAMLELNGVLVAITGTNYKKNPDIIKWYEEKKAKIIPVKGQWKGDNLKVGAEIKNLDRVHIFIRKLKDDMKENQELLKIDDFNTDKKPDIITSIKDLEPSKQEVLDSLDKDLMELEAKPATKNKVKIIENEPERKKYYFPDTNQEEFKETIKVVSKLKGGTPLHRGLIKIIMNRIQESLDKKERPFVYVDEMENPMFKQVVKQLEDLMADYDY